MVFLMLLFSTRFPAGSGGVAVTWDPTAKNANATLSNGNRTVTSAAATHSAGRATTAVGAGEKRYWETPIDETGGGDGDHNIGVGVVSASQTYGNDAYLGSQTHGIGRYNTGNVFRNGEVIATVGTFAKGNVMRHALTGHNRYWTAVGAGAWEPSGDPAAGTGGIDVSGMGDLYPAYNARNNGQGTLDATAFAHTPPSGFSGF